MTTAEVRTIIRTFAILESETDPSVMLRIYRAVARYYTLYAAGYSIEDALFCALCYLRFGEAC